MRTLRVSVILSMTAGLIALAESDARFTVHVKDDLGNDVTGIVVSATTFWKHIPGEGFGTDKHRSQKLNTDTNGLATFSMPCISGEISFGTKHDFPGYYWDRGHKIKFTEDTGQWQPWNPTVELKVKRIENPIPLYTKSVKLQYPEFGGTFGFDLLKADWVRPHGKGECADFIFSTQTHYDGAVVTNYSQKVRTFESAFTLRFSCEDDGIQPFYADPLKGSVLRLPRTAPENKYEKELVQHKYVRHRERYLETRRDENWFFRVRTKKDEEGNVVSALYGKIHGAMQWGWEGGVVFSYYLNPTPNDRNLEFDGKNNLFKPDWRDTSWPKEP